MNYAEYNICIYYIYICTCILRSLNAFVFCALGENATGLLNNAYSIGYIGATGAFSAAANATAYANGSFDEKKKWKSRSSQQK